MYKKLTLIGGLFILEATAFAEPRVGSRVYLTSDDPYALIQIRPLNPADRDDSRVLKDPTFQAVKKIPKMVTRARPEKKRPKYQPKRLSFKKMRVDGRITDPRVAFQQERLSIGRVDERLPMDFLSKLLKRRPDDGL